MNIAATEAFRILLHGERDRLLATLVPGSAEHQAVLAIETTITWPAKGVAMLEAVAALVPQWPAQFDPLPTWFTDPEAEATENPPGAPVVVELAPPAPAHPPVIIDVAKLAAEKTDAVAAAYDAAIARGFSFGGATYALDAATRDNMAAQATAALGSLNGQTTWGQDDGFPDAAGTLHLMTAQEMWDLAAAARERIKALIRKKSGLLAAIQQAVDLDAAGALAAIDTSAGWD